MIEILIVIAVIGVMATGIIVALNPLVQLQKASDGKRKADLSQIQKALETYYQDNNKYPPSTPDYKIKGLDNNAVVWGSSWQPYMSILPKDPSFPSKTYVYFSTDTNGQTYYIYASLDRGGNDPQACFPSGNSCSSATTNNISTACGGNCNYGVSSPNVSP